MADILKKDPAIYQRERDSFIRDLKHFHEARGTPVRRLPFVNGKELDLYLLYLLVTSKGGWVKVNQRNEWSAILDQFESFNHCVNGEVALKQIYLRHLDRYEKINFLGETCDRNADDDEDGRHKRFSSRTSNSVPHLYNYHQHIVPDNVRAGSKLSQNLYVASEYDKLALSLISPLPNEQDFAINVCALLSGTNNEGKNATLKLCNHPRLLHYLLAHAAVYNHNSLRNLMEENYKEIRGYSLKYFWTDVLEDKELSILMDEKKHVSRRDKGAVSGSINDSNSPSSDAEENQKYGDDDVDARLKLSEQDNELFCVGRSYGTQDFVGQRVLQVAMILRNATFIEENVPTLARDSTFLRFVLLCCGSRWNCLHQLGFDMLSNIAHEITLEEYLVEHLLRIVCRGLESPDRTVILGCIETLNKLGQKEENEEVLLRCIEQKVYTRICSFLSLHDIMLLIHALECLYSLSSLGEKACNSIVHVRGAIDSLVSLVTVEAQSYGPKACILMRVVETVTGDPQETETPFFSTPTISHSIGSVSNAASTLNVVSSSSSNAFALTATMTTPLVSSVPSLVATSIPNATSPIVTVSSLLQATPLPTPTIASPVAVPVPLQHTRPSTPQRVVLPLTTTVSANPPAVSVTSTMVVSSTMVAPATVTVGSHSSIVATQQENENFASQWLRTTFETHTQSGRGIEQGEMYKLYLTACSRAGRRGVIAPLHFPQVVRSVFGNNIGPRQVVPANPSGNAETNTSKLFIYEGLQVRAKPMNVTVTPSTLTQPARTPSSPILKAQLSSPSTPNTSKKEVKSKVSSSHPHLSNVLLNAGTNTMPALPSLKQANQQPQCTVAISVSSTVTSTDSSNSTSLIKSLLASKVGDLMSPKSPANIKNEKSIMPASHQLVVNTAIAAQVTQRQQQQQQQLQQHHKIGVQPHLQAITQTTDTQNIHILPQTTDLSKQIVQIAQPSSQPQLVQVIQTSQSQDQKPQIIQLTPAAQQQLLQVNPSGDKPQLVQISHPNGQQQLIQITPSGQQQLLQICQQASQNSQQSIIQMCPVKQEQSVQTAESIAPQQVILSQSGQPPQMIQLTPALQQQLLPQITQTVQQKFLQAPQIAHTTRAVLAPQLLPDQGTQNIAQQTLPVTDASQQFTIVPQVKQLLQDQQQNPQVKSVQSHTVGSHFSQSSQIQSTVPLTQQLQFKQDQSVQSPAVSVITSTASATMKPFVSRINGMRTFTPVNVMVDDDKNDLSASLFTDEKLESSPELPSSSNSNDSSDFPKQMVANQTGSKVIVENHTVTSTPTTTFSTGLVNSKNLKFNDLDPELSESSNQSLPVISIKDTENNLPACELGNEDSTGMFEDFLINGKTTSTLDDSMSNNIMSEDSLLNNIIMREELANCIILSDNTIGDSAGDFNTNANSTKAENAEKTNATKIADKNGKESNFGLPTNSLKKETIIQTDSVETQTKYGNNFINVLKTDAMKNEEKHGSTKNLMLAELLEKNTDKKEPPLLNGAIRLGEKGLELITKDELQRNLKTNVNEKSVICSNKKNFVTKNNADTSEAKPEFLTPTTSNQRMAGNKRTNDQEVQCDTEVKKPHLNGDTIVKLNSNDDETPDESNVKASSSAANLYAALAADVLDDIDGMEDEDVSSITPAVTSTAAFTAVTPTVPAVVESQPSQQLYLTAGHNSRQFLVATTPPGLASRVSIMGAGGQQYFVTPQTAIVQGQQQTVLVTQTAQQHGTGAKTIIILQSQNAPTLTTQQSVTTNQQQKVIMQKVSNTPSPAISVSSAPVIVSTSLSNAIKSAQQPKIMQSTAQSQGTQISANQFLPIQSVASASSQTHPVGSNQMTNVFSLSNNTITQTLVSTQCNVGAQTTVVSQLPQITQVSTLVGQQNTTQTVTTNVVNSVPQSQQPQQQLQQQQCRQVKVIKTVPHLQPVAPNKMLQQPQVHLQQQSQTPPQIQSTVVPVITTAAAITTMTTVSATAVVTAVSTTVVSTPTVATTTTKTSDQGQFLCEWRSCMRSFKTANEVYLHACAAHCPSGSQEIQCLWERCDAMKRKRFSLMTHLYDRHCNPEILRMMAVRRKQISQSGRSEIPPPLLPTPHPGYAPNAALHAIKRHALEFVNPKELQDDNEGPVTKSIRLTSSLILRNVVIYSTGGRRHLTSFEPHLASIALSNVESSRTIAQILYDMNEPNR